MGPPRSSPDLARRVRVYSDPLQHAALAALVVSPLAARTDSRVLRTAVAAVSRLCVRGRTGSAVVSRTRAERAAIA